MNYQKVHDLIIERAKTRVLVNGTYIENHHIIPKCMGGSNDKQNLVPLTGREHFIVHWLLHRIYPENHKLGVAFFRSSKVNHVDRQFTPSSRAYEEARIAQSRASKANNTGRILSKEEIERKRIANQMFRDVPKTDAHRKKISETRVKIGIPPWNKGLKLPKEMYNSRRGRSNPMSDDLDYIKLSRIAGKFAYDHYVYMCGEQQIENYTIEEITNRLENGR